MIASYSAKCQKVFSVDYESQADVKVFVVNYESQADLKVFKVDYESQVGQNDGRWFFVKYIKWFEGLKHLGWPLSLYSH